ncbi:MAG: metal ABC transporter permease [Erysipelothrix sp.]|nr:metal ABC transporter permease [Erysipelothrix sp.]
MDILTYSFMQRALLVGLLLGIIVPMIGVIMVSKRLAMIGDALSHGSLAGVTIGLILGFNPILGATAFAIFAALSIEFIRKKIPRYSEMSIAIITSTGIGIAGLLSGFVDNASNFNSFLFGSIVAINDLEMQLVILISVVVIGTFVLLYKEFFYIALDERSARLSGVNVSVVNFISTMMTAITVSMAARSVGALIVSSLMVIPVASAMQLAKSYFQTVLYSIVFGVLFTVGGLFVSYHLSLKPGGTIVLLGVVTLSVLFVIKALLQKQKEKKVLHGK